MVKLVGGWGINDSTEPVGSRASGSFKIVCPFYIKWASMINRVHNSEYKKKQPTYEGVEICGEWKHFSNFKRWMEQQDWDGMHLDKDLLGSGLLYSPETCCFVPQSINNLLTTRENHRGLFPLGVYKNDGKKPFKATCNTGSGRVYLGRFSCPFEAHRAWQAEKVKVIVALTKAWTISEKPPRKEIVSALLNKASKIQADILEGRLTEKL